MGPAVKAVGGGLSRGVSASGMAAGHGLTAVGESLSTLGCTINSDV